MVPWLVHGFSLRRAINFKVKPTLDFNNQIYNKKQESIRNQFIKDLTGEKLPLVLLNQTHSEKIHCLNRFAPENPIQEGDALITTLPKILLGIQVADCLSILIVDTSKRVIAAIHAGWRGLLKGVVPKTIALMQSHYSVNPRNCIAVIGPSIGSCCYEVGTEVAIPFRKTFKNHPSIFNTRLKTHTDPIGSHNPFRYDPTTKHLNLSAACRYQLQSSGLDPHKISSDPPCTFCHNEVFFSYRANKAEKARMLAIIGLVC